MGGSLGYEVSHAAAEVVEVDERRGVLAVVVGTAPYIDIGDATRALHRHGIASGIGVRRDEDACDGRAEGGRFLCGHVDIEGGKVLGDASPDLRDIGQFARAEAGRLPVGIVGDGVEIDTGPGGGRGNQVTVNVQVQDLRGPGRLCRLNVSSAVNAASGVPVPLLSTVPVSCGVNVSA